jgi:hypothetical protein
MTSNLLCAAALAIACAGKDTSTSGDHQPPPRVIDSQSALSTANTNFRAHFTGAAKAGLVANDSKLLKQVLSTSGASCASIPQPSGTSGAPAPGSSPCRMPDLKLDDQATSSADDIAQKILNSANVESAEPTKVVLKIPAERLCGSSTGAGASGGSVPPGPPQQPPQTSSNADCIKTFTDVPVRLELTSHGDNDIDIALLIGQGRANPATLFLTMTRSASISTSARPRPRWSTSSGA